MLSTNLNMHKLLLIILTHFADHLVLIAIKHLAYYKNRMLFALIKKHSNNSFLFVTF